MACYKFLERTSSSNKNIHTVISKEILRFLFLQGINEPTLYPIKSGRNSRVWRVEDPSGTRILKQYFSNQDDLRERLGTEFKFLRFLDEKDLNNIPKPLSFDIKLNLGLYSWLPGDLVKIIDGEKIKQAASFIIKLNLLRKKPSSYATFCR